MFQRFRERPVLAVTWVLNLLTITGFAVFGSQIVDVLNRTIGIRGITWMLGVIIGALFLGAVGWAVKKGNKWPLIHFVWPAILIAGCMVFVANNPRRWLHIPLFATLGFLSPSLFSTRTGAEITLGYSFLDELLQLYLPYRTGSFVDVIINMSCGVAGIMVYLIGKKSME